MSRGRGKAGAYLAAQRGVSPSESNSESRILWEEGILSRGAEEEDGK